MLSNHIYADVYLPHEHRALSNITPVAPSLSVAGYCCEGELLRTSRLGTHIHFHLELIIFQNLLNGLISPTIQGNFAHFDE